MLPLLLGAVGAGLSAYGAIQQGKDQKKAAYAQAIQKQRASKELQTRANINKAAESRKFQTERADISNQTESSGFTADSSLSYLNKSLENEFRSALNIDRETEYERESLDLETKALRAGGKAAERAGMINAGSSILSGAANFNKGGGLGVMKDWGVNNLKWSIS